MDSGDKEEMIGQTISHYTILEKLGEGGMGVVYKALDTKLNREVALKFLPPHISQGGTERERFLQEAQAAAALNHPNICVIFDIREDAEQPFIVMEYVDGSTIRKKLESGPMKMDDATKFGIQIGEALQEAHSKGIVHRDIKADNIIINSNGQAKVMDFGLAKLKGSLKLTRTSSTVGTLGYMAPEQIQGGEVDPRSDIFAFGVLLFEMLSGRLPFRGEHEAAMMYSIINEDPENIQKLVPEASPELSFLLKTALEKNPEDRYQHMSDVIRDLRRLKKQSSRVNRPAFSGEYQQLSKDKERSSEGRENIVEPKSRKNVFLYGGIGVVLVVIALISYRLFFYGSNDTLPFSTMKLTRLTTDGKASDVAISSDGRYVAYVRSEKEKNNLWLRQVATTSNAPITQPTEDNIGGMTFSPNGDFLYYLVNKQGTNKFDLYQISVLGGNQRMIMPHVDSHIAFSPDGKRFAFLSDSSETQTSLNMSDADGTNGSVLLRRKAPAHFDDLSWSHDGKYIALIEGRSGSYLNHRILVYSLDNGKETLLPNQQWLTLTSINWLDNGKGLMVTAADEQSSFDAPQIWYFPFTDGAARKVTNNLNGYFYSVIDGRSDQIAALETESFSNLHVVNNNSASAAKQLTEGTKKQDGIKGVKWLNDDQIVYCSQSSGNDNIWLTNERGEGESQITSGLFVDRSPSPVPNHNAIVFSSNRNGIFNIWRCDLNGSNLKQLSHGNYDINPLVTPDGGWIIYGSFGDNDFTTWKMTANGDSIQHVMNKHAQSYALSDDGKYFAYVYFNEDQKQKLAIMSLGTKEVIKEIDYPHTLRRWTPDGKGLAYINTRDGVSNIWSQPIDGGKPKQVTEFKTGKIFSFDWTRDGRKLVVARGESNTDIVLLTDQDKIPH